MPIDWTPDKELGYDEHLLFEFDMLMFNFGMWRSSNLNSRTFELPNANS